VGVRAQVKPGVRRHVKIRLVHHYKRHEMLKKSLQRFEDIPNLHQKINAVSDVINNRPSPLRKYDQIYMKAADMVLQAELVQGLIVSSQ
jgi:hypothetical protein